MPLRRGIVALLKGRGAAKGQKSAPVGRCCTGYWTASEDWMTGRPDEELSGRPADWLTSCLESRLPALLRARKLEESIKTYDK